MTCYDSSVLIDYLAGEPTAVNYIKQRTTERSVAPSLVLFEVYQGEVFKQGPADFAAVDDALEWVTIVDGTANAARSAAELQQTLREEGTPLAARDAFVAGTALALGEPLAVSDADFDIPGITDRLDVDFL